MIKDQIDNLTSYHIEQVHLSPDKIKMNIQLQILSLLWMIVKILKINLHMSQLLIFKILMSKILEQKINKLKELNFINPA